MYKYTLPHPIVIELGYDKTNRDYGYKLREQAAEYVEHNRSKGAQAANDDRQGYGILAEIVIREKLNLTPINKDPHPVAYDIMSDAKVKIDIKCRGGEKNFEELYPGNDGYSRDAKHNLFARQLYDKSLDCDLFLLTHLRRPSGKKSLPGGKKDRSWRLFICGWISKKRALKEAVYIPPGGITEQGNRWFPYQYHNIEIYNKCLNGLNKIEDLLPISMDDVINDGKTTLSLHMTSVDAYRITSDMIGRDIITNRTMDFIKREFKLSKKVKPVFHPNQYFHLMKWLITRGKATKAEYKKLQKLMKEEKFKGL